MKRILFIAAPAAIAASIALAQEVAPGDVAFSEYGEVVASLTGVAGDPVNGAAVMTSRGKGNCIACHQVTALEEYPFHGEVGPSLDGVGDRWDVSQLRGLVTNAKMTFDGTVMPAFYKSNGFVRPGNGYTGKAAQGDLPPILTAQEIEDVVAYLLTLSDS